MGYTDEGTADEIRKGLEENAEWERQHPHVPTEEEIIERKILAMGISNVVWYLRKIGYTVTQPE